MVTVTWAAMRMQFCMAGGIGIAASVHSRVVNEAGPASTSSISRTHESTRAYSAHGDRVPLSKYAAIRRGDRAKRLDLVWRHYRACLEGWLRQTDGFCRRKRGTIRFAQRE